VRDRETRTRGPSVSISPCAAGGSRTDEKERESERARVKEREREGERQREWWVSRTEQQTDCEQLLARESVGGAYLVQREPSRPHITPDDCMHVGLGGVGLGGDRRSESAVKRGGQTQWSKCSQT
jgi:hypothetical protein